MDLDDAYNEAVRLVAEHGLREWSVRFDSAKRRAGVCRYESKTIGISAPLTVLHSEAEVRDTILHEIAHALVGRGHGHDEAWRATAIRIGSSGTRCMPPDAAQVETAWLGVCPAGHTVGRHRAPARVTTCTKCAPEFDLAHLIKWTRHGRPARMHANYEEELRQLRTGGRLTIFRLGARVRIKGEGAYAGLEGAIDHVGRTQYRVRTDAALLQVPFALVEPTS